MSFPAQPEELTSAWLTQMLRNKSALGAENSVTDFSHEIIGAGVGVVGMVVRIALQYSSPQNAGPASVVAKFAHPEAANRAIANNTNMYEREVDFFNKTAHNVATPMPTCYFASMNYDTGISCVPSKNGFSSKKCAAGNTASLAAMLLKLGPGERRK